MKRKKNIYLGKTVDKHEGYITFSHANQYIDCIFLETKTPKLRDHETQSTVKPMEHDVS